MMVAVGLASRLLLALIFGVAALAKLRDREGFRRSLSAFGLPAKVVPALALLLPALELAAGAALILRRTAIAGAVLASALLAIFSAAIAWNLGRGRRPECRCFGQLSTRPVGGLTLLRNAGLIALAALAALPQGESIARRDVVAGVGVALAALLIGTVIFLVVRLRNLTERVAALEARPIPAVKGLPVGSAAPDFSAPELSGATWSLSALLATGRPLCLYFFDPACGPCMEVLPLLARWQDEHSERMRFVLLGRRAAKSVSERRYGNLTVLWQEDREISQSYRVGSIPSAVVIGPNGRVASPLAIGREAIEQLVGREIVK